MFGVIQLSSKVEQMVTAFDGIANILQTEFTEVAKALIPLLLSLYFVFLGLRLIIFKGSFAEDLAALTIRCAILSLLVYAFFPQNLLLENLQRVDLAGRSIGNSIASVALSGASGETPIDYWQAWMANGGSTEDGKALGRFSEEYVTKNIFGLKSEYKDSVGVVLNTLSGIALTSFGVSKGFLGSFSTGATYLAIITGMLFLSILFAYLLGFFTAITTYIGAIVMMVLMSVACVLGPQICLKFVAFVGLGVLPLMIFRTFDKIWVTYLIFLVGCLLSLFFYYVASGIGYWVVDSIVHFFFEGSSGGQGDTIPTFVGEQLKIAVKSTSEFLAPYLKVIEKVVDVGTSITSLAGLDINKLATNIVMATIYIAAWTGGTAILAALVAFGVGFGTVGAAIGLKWTDAFASPELMQMITTGLRGVTNATQSAYGSVASSVINQGQQAGQAGMGFARTAGGSIFSGLGGLAGKLGRRR